MNFINKIKTVEIVKERLANDYQADLDYTDLRVIFKEDEALIVWSAYEDVWQTVPFKGFDNWYDFSQVFFYHLNDLISNMKYTMKLIKEDRI